MKLFPCKQKELEAKINEWLKKAPEKIKIDYVESYTGYRVYAITVSDFTVPQEQKRAHYFAQPHAHEPGATAGMIDVLEELITGKDIYGNSSNMDVDNILKRTILTFNPIGNPAGRDKAPVDCWDGSYCDNERFWCWMRGEDPDNPGKCWKRLDIWDPRDHNTPDPVGIVYEQISEFKYAEPNRTQESSYFKLFHKMDAMYHFEAWLDLHQTEFVDSEYNSMILLAIQGEEGSKDLEAEKKEWSIQIIKEWENDTVLHPIPEAEPLTYTGIQAEYFRKNFGPIHKRMSMLSTEVKNNSPEMTPEVQMRGQAIAIRASIERLAAK